MRFPIGGFPGLLGVVHGKLLCKLQEIFPAYGISGDPMIVEDFKVGFVIRLRNCLEDHAETIYCSILGLGSLGRNAKAKVDLSLGLGWSDVTCFDACVVGGGVSGNRWCDKLVVAPSGR